MSEVHAEEGRPVGGFRLSCPRCVFDCFQCARRAAWLGRLKASLAMRVFERSGPEPVLELLRPSHGCASGGILQDAEDMFLRDVGHADTALPCGDSTVPAERWSVQCLSPRSSPAPRHSGNSRMLPGQAYCCSAHSVVPGDRVNPLAQRASRSATKRHTRSGISSARSRSGGTWIGRRSAIEQVLAKCFVGDPLQISRVRGRDEPHVHLNAFRAAKLLICRSSSTRSILTWTPAGRSPILSRKIVERSADSKRTVL